MKKLNEELISLNISDAACRLRSEFYILESQSVNYNGGKYIFVKPPSKKILLTTDKYNTVTAAEGHQLSLFESLLSSSKENILGGAAMEKQIIRKAEFKDLLPDETGETLDHYFKEKGWELQLWEKDGTSGYQVYFGKEVQVDNLFEYGFPYLYDKEEVKAFAKHYYRSHYPLLDNNGVPIEENVWICVYKDTLGYPDDYDNLTEILVSRDWLMSELKALGEKPEDWFCEYIADNTDDMCRKALDKGLILDCNNDEIKSKILRKTSTLDCIIQGAEQRSGGSSEATASYAIEQEH